MSTVAFYIKKNGWQAQPGTVFKRMLEYRYQDTSCKHILFVEPFLWEEKLGVMTLAKKKVHFLMAVPITDTGLNLQGELAVLN